MNTHGKGFSLTESIELAKEWAVCRTNDANGCVHKYELETDVICCWRANASYFYIAKEFIRDNIDIDILEELLSLGGLGIQYCMKSEAAYADLTEKTDELLPVPYTEFNNRYN